MWSGDIAAGVPDEADRNRGGGPEQGGDGAGGRVGCGAGLDLGDQWAVDVEVGTSGSQGRLGCLASESVRRAGRPGIRPGRASIESLSLAENGSTVKCW